MSTLTFTRTAIAKIVVVDDEILVRNAVRRKLLVAGYRIRLFTSGREAFDAIINEGIEIDLLLTDWELLDDIGEWKDGANLIMHLRKHGMRHPMILWSGNKDVFKLHEDGDNGPSRILGKEQAGELLEIIAELLSE